MRAQLASSSWIWQRKVSSAKGLASTGAELRLTVAHPGGAEAEIQMPRRGAPTLSRGAPVTLAVQAATIFADAPMQKETA